MPCGFSAFFNAIGMNSVIREKINPAMSSIHLGILLFIFGNSYLSRCTSFFPKSQKNLCTWERTSCFNFLPDQKMRNASLWKGASRQGENNEKAANFLPFTRSAQKSFTIVNLLFPDSPQPIMFKGNFLWVSQLNRNKMHQTVLFANDIMYSEVPTSLMDFYNKGWSFSHTFLL